MRFELGSVSSLWPEQWSALLSTSPPDGWANNRGGWVSARSCLWGTRERGQISNVWLGSYSLAELLPSTSWQTPHPPIPPTPHATQTWWDWLISETDWRAKWWQKINIHQFHFNFPNSFIHKSYGCICMETFRKNLQDEITGGWLRCEQIKLQSLPRGSQSKQMLWHCLSHLARGSLWRQKSDTIAPTLMKTRSL